MSQMITVRMSEDRVARLDSLVAAGAFRTRAGALREAVDRLLADEEGKAIDREIVEGYTRIPSTPEEDAWAEWSARESIGEEPW